MTRNADAAFVYIARSKCGRLFKIGKAKDVTVRLRHVGADCIDVSNSFILRVSNNEQAYRLERYLHLAFAEWRVDKQQATAVVGREYGGLTEWFQVACLPRLDAILDQCADLFPHERVAGPAILESAERRPKSPGTAKQTYTDEELWGTARPQVDKIASLMGTVIEQVQAPLIRDFGFGYGQLHGFCNSGLITPVAQSLEQVYTQGVVKLASQSIALVTGCMLPSKATEFNFCLYLNFPGPWDTGQLSTRIRTYFVELLSDACAMEILDARDGWREFLRECDEVAKM